jgi:hypothetical protein
VTFNVVNGKSAVDKKIDPNYYFPTTMEQLIKGVINNGATLNLSHPRFTKIANEVNKQGKKKSKLNNSTGKRVSETQDPHFKVKHRIIANLLGQEGISVDAIAQLVDCSVAEVPEAMDKL